MQSLIEIGPIQNMIGNQIVTHNSVFSIILQLFFFLYALAHNEPRSMNLNQHASIILQHCLLALAVLCTTLFYRYSVLLKGTFESYIWQWQPPAARSNSQRPVLTGRPVCRAPLSHAQVQKICRTHCKLKINAPIQSKCNFCRKLQY